MSNTEYETRFLWIMQDWEAWLKEREKNCSQYSETFITMNIENDIQAIWKLYHEMKGEDS